MNHSLYQDGILKPLPFKRLPWSSMLDMFRIGQASSRNFKRLFIFPLATALLYMVVPG